MIRENILKIREKIALSCAKADRGSSEVTLVGVCKNRSLNEIQELLAAGIKDIGENKVQEALEHHKAFADSSSGYTALKWHMIGHLQTNKVKDAVKIFDLMHSVDSLRLAQEIDKQAGKINKVQDILIEVNTSGEKSKFGIAPGELLKLASEVRDLGNIRLLGLMAMAPEDEDPEKARPYFRRLQELLAEVNRLSTMNYQLSVLSMGMSDDFWVAVEEGATMVRIGRAVFEEGLP